MPVFNSRFASVAIDQEGQEHSVDPSWGITQKGPIVEAKLMLGEQYREVAISQKMEIEEVKGLALIDTGASVTCFDQEAAEMAGFPVSGTSTMASATHARKTVPTYLGCGLEIKGFMRLYVARAMGVKLESQGLIALIGRDALHKAVFIYNGAGGAFSLML